MKQTTVCLNTGHIVLHYETGSHSAIFPNQNVMKTIENDAQPELALIRLAARMSRYLLDEGFEPGYTIPFRIVCPQKPKQK